MKFSDYQKEAHKTAIHNRNYEILMFQLGSEPSDPMAYTGLPWVYAAFGLANEVGEVSGKLKKVIRDSDGIISDELREKLKSEMGDVLWYFSELCSNLELKLDEVAESNLEKLASRQERGVLKGSGDNR